MTTDLIDEVYLQPGEFWFGGGDTQLRTLLGSCVAIALWHPVHRIGGMCHIILPDRDVGRGAPSHLPARYADEAVQLFRREVAQQHTLPEQYVVKLFGGGRMLSTGTGQIDIGERNVLAARRHLAHGGFRISREHVGDSGHRQLVFDLPSGDVWLRHVRDGQPQPAAAKRTPNRMKIAPALIAWNDSYRVKVVMIDDQHENLIQMLNQLFQQIVAGGDEQIEIWLNRLDRYAEQHFTLEERLMREHAVERDHRRGHEAAHERYRQRIRQFRQAMRQQGQHAPIQLMAFLSSWWTEHIQGTDRLLGEQLNACGVY